VKEEDSEEMRMKNTWFVLFGVQKSKNCGGKQEKKNEDRRKPTRKAKKIKYCDIKMSEQ
jgi:hypothetical protein